MRNSSAGEAVASGQIRVDAGRAIQKLRDYRLETPEKWVLEAIRAAIACGATRIELQGDSNDVWLGWEGIAWESESLPELFNELVSPLETTLGRERRYLATAINSALGLNLSYFDLYSIKDGRASRVRFETILLAGDTKCGETSDFANLKVEEVTSPAKAPLNGMFLHLRRRVGMSPLKNLLRGYPLELSYAEDSCHDLKVPILIGKKEHGAHIKNSDLLRIKLKNGIEGYLALVDSNCPDMRGAYCAGKVLIEVAECGVILANYWAEVPGIQCYPLFDGLTMPLRFYINAKQMPTNASRSGVRFKDFPLREAMGQLSRLHHDVYDRLVRILEAGSYNEHLRSAALELLFAELGVNRKISPHQRGLADFPLLQNALGEARSYSAYWLPLAVYSGVSPLEEKYRPWFEYVLWVPVGSKEELLRMPGYDLRVREVLRSAKKKIRKRRQFLSHAVRDTTINRGAESWMYFPIESASGQEKSCTGEVCLLKEGTVGTIVVLHELRELEQIEVPSGLPFLAIVNSKTITADENYKSCMRDFHFSNMLVLVYRAVINSVEALCRVPSVESIALDLLSEFVKRALYLCTLHSIKSPLLEGMPVWNSTLGTKLSVLDMQKEDVLGVSFKKGEVSPPNRNVFYVRSREELRTLLDLSSNMNLIDYTDSQYRTSRENVRAFKNELSEQYVLLGIEEDSFQSGIVYWSAAPTSLLEIYHCSVKIYAQIRLNETSIKFNSDNLSLDDKNTHEIISKIALMDWDTRLVRAVAERLTSIRQS